MQGLEAEIERLLAHPRFDHAAHRLARDFLAVQAASPRLASQFSTQQRWLMSHAVLSHYFRGRSAGRMGLSRRDFVEQALAHGLASRNTAAAFFVEARQYGLVQPTRAHADVVQPAPATLQALIEWYAIHLAARDSDHVRDFVMEHLSEHPAVSSTRTSIVFSHHQNPVRAA